MSIFCTRIRHNVEHKRGTSLASAFLTNRKRKLYFDTEDETKMAVIVSGPVLASVLYGQTDCPGDQVG